MSYFALLACTDLEIGLLGATAAFLKANSFSTGILQPALKLSGNRSKSPTAPASPFPRSLGEVYCCFLLQEMEKSSIQSTVGKDSCFLQFLGLNAF